jgi:choline dehydrogenase-like flavoprotein
MMCVAQTLVWRSFRNGFHSGADGWDGDRFWENMKNVSLQTTSCLSESLIGQCESFHPSPEFRHDQESHGYNGPIHTQPHELAPISQNLFESLESFGIPRMMTCSRRYHQSWLRQHCPTVHQGLRSNATAYLAKKRRNLTVICRSTVLRILVRRQKAGLRTYGVEIQDEIGGGVRTIKANEEVVLCWLLQ